jgi:Flp pilus assembly protein TadB
MIDAERMLLAEALQDQTNQRFVLVSDRFCHVFHEFLTNCIRNFIILAKISHVFLIYVELLYTIFGLVVIRCFLLIGLIVGIVLLRRFRK